MTAKLAGYVCVAIALALLAFVAYRTILPTPGPLLFSPTELLAATWHSYKATYVNTDFETVDRTRGVTTSEGQSYTMLRAVWMGDKTTFDGTWQWTEAHLGRTTDHLFAWLWGPETSGGTGILSENTASDADSDIALSLIFAYARWQDPRYLAAARAILADIWSEEVVTIKGVPYLAADNLEKTAKTPSIVVNPSYLSPASYHIFAEVDTAHPWESLRSASYDLLAKSASLPLDASTSGNLPPDWILVSRTSGSIAADTQAGADTNFGYDALRVPWRIALDYEWFKNPQARTLLSRFSLLSSEWREAGRIPSIQTHSGGQVDGSETAALYGGTIGYFLLADPAEAPTVFREKLLALWSPARASWATTLSYYDDNWVWFGIGLYEGMLPDLAAGLPPSAFST